jgi:hypothetical protein
MVREQYTDADCTTLSNTITGDVPTECTVATTHNSRLTAGSFKFACTTSSTPTMFYESVEYL